MMIIHGLASPTGRLAKQCLLRHQGDLQNTALGRCFMIDKVCIKVSGCQIGIGHCFNRAFMPVSLRKLDIQCIHA